MYRALGLALFVTLAPCTGIAEETICAAVLPCAVDGSVLQEFRGSPCESLYEATCRQFAVKDSSEDLAACIDDTAQLSAKQQQLEQEISTLRGKLRAARRAAKR